MNHLKTFQRAAVVVLAMVAGFSSKLSAQTCPVSNEITITVIPEATITTAGATTICSGGDATLTATPSGGTGTCTIQWQSSSNGGSTWASISGATSATLNITLLTATTSYRAIYTCDGSGCDPVPSNSQTVTVNPDLSFTADLTNITQCIDGTSQLSVTTTGGSGGPLTYRWEQSTNNATWNVITGANTSTYTPPSTTAGTTYYRVTVSDAVSGCQELPSSVSTVVINPDLAISAFLNPITECIGGNDALTVATTGGSGLGLTYTWEQSSNNSDWDPATGATNAASYIPPSTTAGTMSYRVRISDGVNGCDAITAAATTVTITPPMTIPTSGNLANITECIGGTNALTITVNGGSGGTKVYTWEQSTTGSSWSAAAGATNAPTYQPLSATAGTMYYRVRVSDAASGCGEITSATSTVVITPNLTISTDLVDISECIGGNTALTVATLGGSGGALTYTWEQSTTGLPGSWSAAAGATNSTNYIPSSATAGIMYYHVTIADAASGCGSITSANSTVTINPDISISAQPAPVVECVDGTLPMSVTASGGVGTLTYQWEESTDGGSTYSPVSGATSATYVAPSTTPGTKHYRVVISNTGNDCQSITSTATTVTVVAKPTIAIAATVNTVCVGGGSVLTATPANGTGTCTIQWLQSTNGGATYNDIPGATGTTYTTPGLNANTTYRARYTCDGNGCCN